MDLNVVPVYNLGYTGKGVTIAVVNDGIASGLSDLQKNFVSSLFI